MSASSGAAAVAWKYRAPGKSFWRVTLDSRINPEWERVPLFEKVPDPVDWVEAQRLVQGAIGYLQIGLNSQCMNKLRELERLIGFQAVQP